MCFRPNADAGWVAPASTSTPLTLPGRAAAAGGARLTPVAEDAPSPSAVAGEPGSDAEEGSSSEEGSEEGPEGVPEGMSEAEFSRRGIPVPLEEADLELMASMGVGQEKKPKRPEYKMHKKAARTKGDRGKGIEVGLHLDGAGVVIGRRGGVVRK